MRIAGAIGGAMLCLAGAAQAQTVVALSRATVELGAGDWVELERTQRVVARVERWGDLVAEVVASGLVDHDRLRAVVVVTSTRTSPGGRVDWGDGCPAGTELAWSAPLRGGHPEDRECAEATVPLGAASLLAHRPQLREALRSRALVVPNELVSIAAEIMTRHGRMMSVDVLADTTFVGLPGGDVGPLPARLRAGHVAYAAELGQRVRGSLFSIRGRMELPPITFAADAPAGARIASSLH
jgi:hypothetical protein